MGATAGRSSPGNDLRLPHTRVAIPDEEGHYDILEVTGEDFPAYADNLTALVEKALRSRDAAVPFLALREIVDNLIHALPCSVSVALDPQANNIFVSDTGPGIARLDLAFELGYSTAGQPHRSFIRGVGLGLYLAREELRSLGGELRIESDPGAGTYVHLCLSGPLPPQSGDEDEGSLRLTQRQNNILFLLSEGESLGPSQVSSELNIGVSTAHRDLVKLQEFRLIYVGPTGKRFLSEVGRSYLQSLLSL